MQSLVTIPHAKLLRRLARLSAAPLALVKRVLAQWLGLAASNPETEHLQPTAATRTS